MLLEALIAILIFSLSLLAMIGIVGMQVTGMQERMAFKADVRKLKELGLTHSLPVGYEISPRGRAYLG